MLSGDIHLAEVACLSMIMPFRTNSCSLDVNGLVTGCVQTARISQMFATSGPEERPCSHTHTHTQIPVTRLKTTRSVVEVVRMRLVKNGIPPVSGCQFILTSSVNHLI